MDNLPQLQVPSYAAALMQDPRLAGLNSALASGTFSSGCPRVSIKGSRFRLKVPGAEELVLQTHYMDIIIVDANPHGLSRTYYEATYDPNAEDQTPSCFSDNGVGPSDQAKNPQCATCAACPHAAWGSKVSALGTQIKACSESKRVAVVMADNAAGHVYELRIPPASLKNWGSYIDQLAKRGYPAAALITRVSFDAASDFPKLMFTATGWATPDQVSTVVAMLDTEEVNRCTGKNDKVATVKGLEHTPSTPVVEQVVQQNYVAAASPAPYEHEDAPKPRTRAAAKKVDSVGLPAQAATPIDVPASSSALDDILKDVMGV